MKNPQLVLTVCCISLLSLAGCGPETPGSDASTTTDARDSGARDRATPRDAVTVDERVDSETPGSDATPDEGTGSETGVDLDAMGPRDATIDGPVGNDATRDAGREAAVDARADAPMPVDVVAPPASMFTVWVSRVGTGTGMLTNAATPVVLERRSAASGAEMGTAIALPTAMMGTQNPFMLSGTATSEGALLRSQDGRYVTMAGYAAAAGTAGISSTTSMAAPRVVARVDARGAVDTSTTLGMAFTMNNVRAAITTNGSAFWVAGTAAPPNGGVHYAMLGANTTVQVLATPSNVRVLGLFDGQLYATASTTGYYGVLSIGMGEPTEMGATATLLTGFSSSTGPSPYGFTALRRATGTGPVDTIYVADDRATASGGGAQRWELRAGTWTLAATHADGISMGLRGLVAQLAADRSGVTIVGVTGESPSRLVAFDETLDGMATPARVLATAPANTQFRGVCLAPTE